MKNVYWVAVLGILILAGSMKIFDQGNQIKELTKQPSLSDPCEKNRCKDKVKITFEAPSSKILKDYFRSLQHHD
jgi:hypothetical protein